MEQFDEKCMDETNCEVNITYDGMSDSCLTELERRAASADTDVLYQLIQDNQRMQALRQ